MSSKITKFILLALLLVAGLIFYPELSRAMNTNPSYTMDGYWWLDDDASGANVEDNTGFGAGNTAQETDITGVNKSSNVRIRVDISETANQDQNLNITPVLEYQSGSVACTGGTWTTITTSTTNAWALVDTSNITDGNSVDSDRISGNSRPFQALGFLLDQSNGSSSALLDFQSLEVEWNIQATSNAADSQTYTFRVTNGGTALNSYSLPANCPRATTAAPATTSLAQNSFIFYTDNDSENVNNIWGNPDLAELDNLDAIPTTNSAPTSTTELRIRMNITVTGAQLDASNEGFKLQFATSTSASLDCSAETGSNFQDVEANGTTAAWVFALSGVTDGTTLTATKLSASDIGAIGRYSKSNPSSTNPNAVAVNEDTEWDWHIQHNASDAIVYCFRMIKDDDTELDSYGGSSYPRITTAPGVNNLLRHGNFFDQAGERGFFWVDLFYPLLKRFNK